MHAYGIDGTHGLTGGVIINRQRENKKEHIETKTKVLLIEFAGRDVDR